MTDDQKLDYELGRRGWIITWFNCPQTQFIQLSSPRRKMKIMGEGQTRSEALRDAAAKVENIP